MNSKMTRRILYAILMLMAHATVFGDLTWAANNGGTTGADFLQIGPGAAPAGMAGAYTAVSQGASATWWNPAGLAGMEAGEVTFSHFAWYQDINLEHGAAAFPLGENFTLAAGVTFLDYGQIQGYDVEGYTTEFLTAYDLAGSISLGVRVNDYLALGVTGKYVTQSIIEEKGTGFAGDFGVKISLGSVTIGAVAANIGPDIKFESAEEKLPTVGRLGVSIRPLGRLLMTSLEVQKKPDGGELSFRQGVELNFMDQYFLRAGYNYYPDREYRQMGSGYSLGAGLLLGRLGLDYAFTPEDTYTSESIHRFSLAVGFGQ